MVKRHPAAGTAQANLDSVLAWRAAESAAHRHLLQQGYLPMARNVRSRYGEIDIVARDGDVLAFIEVKARRGAEATRAGAEAVDRRKQLRMRRLALWYLRESGHPSDCLCRFDVALVTLGSCGAPVAVDVLKDAF